MQRRNRQSGFTLIELLVVIAIISLLVSVLMPSLARAKELAKSALCLSNLRAMAIQANVYVANGDGHYPIAFDGERSWDFDTSGGEIKPGILWLGEQVQKIQQCPVFEGNSNTMSDPYTGYNYNISYIGHGTWETRKEPARIEEVLKPTQCALFGDGEYSGGANKYMRSPEPHDDDTFASSYRYAGTQGYRHLEKTNVAFCDGHAVSWEDCYTAGVPNVAEGTGFLSEDNAMYDLR